MLGVFGNKKCRILLNWKEGKDEGLLARISQAIRWIAIGGNLQCHRAARELEEGQVRKSGAL